MDRVERWCAWAKVLGPYARASESPRPESGLSYRRTADVRMPDRAKVCARRPRLPPGYARHETQEADCFLLTGAVCTIILTSIELRSALIRRALVPTSLLPTRETERTSMRLPFRVGLRRTTTSSLNPNQGVNPLSTDNKKADVMESTEEFHHIGLLFNPRAANRSRAF